MKKTYLQPSLVMAETELVTLVCGSQDITSGSDVNDIGYGGVDEGGTKTPLPVAITTYGMMMKHLNQNNSKDRG